MTKDDAVYLHHIQNMDLEFFLIRSEEDEE